MVIERRNLWSGLWTLALLLCPSSLQLGAQEGFQIDRFQGFLDSGEFHAASQMISPFRGTLDGDQRLAELAQDLLISNPSCRLVLEPICWKRLAYFFLL